MKNTKLMLGLLVSSMALQPIMQGMETSQQRTLDTDLSEMSKSDLTVLYRQKESNLFDIIRKHKNLLDKKDQCSTLENQKKVLIEKFVEHEKSALKRADSCANTSLFYLATSMLTGLMACVFHNDIKSDIAFIPSITSLIFAFTSSLISSDHSACADRMKGDCSELEEASTVWNKIKAAKDNRKKEETQQN